MSEQELKHYGVKGMKWGVQRAKKKYERKVQKLNRAEARISEKNRRFDEKTTSIAESRLAKYGDKQKAINRTMRPAKIRNVLKKGSRLGMSGLAGIAAMNSSVTNGALAALAMTGKLAIGSAALISYTMPLTLGTIAAAGAIGAAVSKTRTSRKEKEIINKINSR